MLATPSPKSRLPVIRVAMAGALSAAVFFTLCWLGTFLPIGAASHQYLQLFTAAETGTAAALVQGLCWSVAFGLIAGALFSLFYNALAAVDR